MLNYWGVNYFFVKLECIGVGFGLFNYMLCLFDFGGVWVESLVGCIDLVGMNVKFGVEFELLILNVGSV